MLVPHTNAVLMAPSNSGAHAMCVAQRSAAQRAVHPTYIPDVLLRHLCDSDGFSFAAISKIKVVEGQSAYLIEHLI